MTKPRARRKMQTEKEKAFFQLGAQVRAVPKSLGEAGLRDPQRADRSGTVWCL